MFVPLCDCDYVFVTLLPLVHLKNPQHVLLSSLLVSREKLTVSLWLGGAMGLLNVKIDLESITKIIYFHGSELKCILIALFEEIVMHRVPVNCILSVYV